MARCRLNAEDGERHGLEQAVFLCCQVGSKSSMHLLIVSVLESVPAIIPRSLLRTIVIGGGERYLHWCFLQSPKEFS